MVFSDKYPQRIEFEFNRPALCRIYRLRAWLACVPLLSVFAFLFTAGIFSDFLAMHSRADWVYKLGMGVIYFGAGQLVSLLMASIIYFSYFHRAAALHAQNRRLIVEGPYLRYISGAYVIFDRRFHFRDIHTYTTVQGPLLKRFGVESLLFYSQQRPGGLNQVDGLQDVAEVRDMLCEIDAERTSD